MLYVTFFFSITLLALGLLTTRSDRKVMLKRRIALATNTPVAAGSEADPEPSPSSAKARFRPMRLLWRPLYRIFRRMMNSDPHRRGQLELRLSQAGNPFRMTPVDYRLVHLGLQVVMPIVFSGYAFMFGASLGGTLLAVLIGWVSGYGSLPFYIKLKIKNRGQLALKELPDVLDLLTVSLEAGLGFDAALQKLVSKKSGVLASELQQCLEEIRLGRTRREALIGVRDRIVIDEIRVLISSILQAEKLGIGMVQVLRVQSQEVREQRKQRAEEAAMKAPIKMLFPLVLFIFPSLFIVLLGPAAIQFIQTFK